jgi:hypothetical protein
MHGPGTKWTVFTDSAPTTNSHNDTPCQLFHAEKPSNALECESPEARGTQLALAQTGNERSRQSGSVESFDCLCGDRSPATELYRSQWVLYRLMYGCPCILQRECTAGVTEIALGLNESQSAIGIRVARAKRSATRIPITRVADSDTATRLARAQSTVSFRICIVNNGPIHRIVELVPDCRLGLIGQMKFGRSS